MKNGIDTFSLNSPLLLSKLRRKLNLSTTISFSSTYDNVLTYKNGTYTARKKRFSSIVQNKE